MRALPLLRLPAQVLTTNSCLFSGGGIGGLALVLAIQHFCDLDQLEVNVYESAAQISQIGAGINVWERVYDILTELGMEAEFATHLREGETCECERVACHCYAKEARSSVHLPQERSARGCHFSRGVFGSVR